MVINEKHDPLPCLWCDSPVHVETIGVQVGFYITCGCHSCNCPGVVIYETEQEAVDEWNNGNTIRKINGIYKEELHG